MGETGMNSARRYTGKRIGTVGPLIGLGAIALGCLLATPSWGQTDTVASAQPPAAATVPADTQAAAAGSILKTPPDAKSPVVVAAITTGGTTSPATGSEAHQVAVVIEQLGERLAHLTKAERKKWELATASLPSFCQDWDRLLHDREVNNLSHLDWHQQQGFQTATYTGYGKVQGCQAKESEEGVPIGKVSYQEMSYYLAGKSVDDAKSHPKLLGTTNTLEIFSFEKDRWFY
jgi:hypothetical protein